jgi:cbb3-type cytochrome oxidase maturation protein
MNILVVMIPLSILLLVGAGIAFFWAVDHDQFEDMDTPRLLPLLDNPDVPVKELDARPIEQTRSAPLATAAVQAFEAAPVERADVSLSLHGRGPFRGIPPGGLRRHRVNSPAPPAPDQDQPA